MNTTKQSSKATHTGACSYENRKITMIHASEATRAWHCADRNASSTLTGRNCSTLIKKYRGWILLASLFLTMTLSLLSRSPNEAQRRRLDGVIDPDMPQKEMELCKINGTNLSFMVKKRKNSGGNMRRLDIIKYHAWTEWKRGKQTGRRDHQGKKVSCIGMAYYDITKDPIKLCGSRRIGINPRPLGGKKPTLSYTKKQKELLLTVPRSTNSNGPNEVWTRKLKFQDETEQDLFRQFIEKTQRITTQGKKPTRRRMPERKPWQWLAPLAACDETPSDEIIKAQ